MKQGKILEKLWFTDWSLRSTQWTEEANLLLDELEEKEKDLFANLTEEQQEALESYKIDLNNLRTLFEKDAFMKGVRFATAYMIEALGQSEQA
ncbi:MAG: hypothetical protein J1E00_06975 [Oscillospiraceae bacterium]|nr:hypothetical protein [Oscillospiraceae bacterium]